MYESGTGSAFDAERRGATPSWIVSVLKVGADDASSGHSDSATSPRMMDGLERKR